MAHPPNPPLEVLLFTGSRTTLHPLPDSGTLSVGRGEDNDLQIDDPAVSRRHLLLHLGPPLRVEDAGSANGCRIIIRRSTPAGTVKLQEIRLLPRQSHVIEPGFGVVLGTTILTVQARDGEKAVPSSTRRPRGAVEPVVHDPAMHALHARVERIARGSVSVLLIGEAGVGKEVVAEAIHRRSLRAAKPFLCLSCAAFTGALLESELFGHEGGSFASGGKESPGLLEAADGGTVLLDKVEETPMGVQAKLVRVLEERTVLRIGGIKPRRINVRFISATSCDLAAGVERGWFRQDLLFRLNGIEVAIPPLRERRTEIGPLARSFVAAVCEQLGRRARPELSAETIAALEEHDWPGNIRELRRVIEHAVMRCDGQTISPEHLELQPTSRVRAVPQQRVSTQRMKRLAPEEDQERILHALEQSSGNPTRAAETLEGASRTLVNRLEEYGITRPRKRL